MRHLSGIAAVAVLTALVPAALGGAASAERPDRPGHAGRSGRPGNPAPPQPGGREQPGRQAGPGEPAVLRRQAGPGRQADFAGAAREYGVPESVLLAVSYLESRWDGNAGLPSVSAGYGPMHLVDGRAEPGRPHGAGEDRRGDETRPHVARVPRTAVTPPEDTLGRAAELTGIPAEVLREDPSANIRGGAALLADYQRRTGGRTGGGPARWYDAVARYSGVHAGTTAPPPPAPHERRADAARHGYAADLSLARTKAARSFADEVFATIRSGAARVTDDGEQVSLPATPDLPVPRDRTARRRAAAGPDCPADVSCTWIPATYKRLKKGGYGNHDRFDGDRPIDYIVIHDGETTYDVMTRLAKNPSYLSWHFTLRSSDGHIAQHLRARDIGWHAGNWYVNSRSIGLEHEGYLAKGGAWFTEAMYRSSARLVRHLAAEYDIPLDRSHILGHDNVPGPTPDTVRGMHDDPGPYWDWDHYFELLGEPFDAPEVRLVSGPGRTPAEEETVRSVLIRPEYATNAPGFTGCKGGCPRLGGASVWLRTRPSATAPLVKDVGKHAGGGSSYSVYDHAARASTGQRYAFAERRGDWTAIWYLGQKAWFLDPEDARTSVTASGPLVTPRPGLSSVKVYGRAYPEKAAYPEGVPVQEQAPLQYSMPAGQAYSVGMTVRSSYLRAAGFDPAGHRIVRGATRYRQIQFGHRIMYVRAADVRLLPG
ncbi:N-acetyl-anhydromuramyl-L-alanine amidase AmpD [Streptosporangium becharense]|uniref:N-acetylmuramoyl-L-alanine amidase n=1 Tax=Streptosporangium becharense TaxID=1816182 RepID=A0A7W9IMF4_9ACTN|nr:peptidoglycan recognition family protein [Streptosporangium becharense]MBB2911453.1 N-acetyl-anhydromuramyl-L-alanine amidase AmpD [Streptosporangium becharense]MBB5822729.1 N-acetyl-anhydromuramyl-L-alanine amidase AmpD [Streptosporangium becharense]